MQNERFILEVVTAIRKRGVDSQNFLNTTVAISGKDKINLGVILPVNHILKKVYVNVIEPAESGSISLGPKGIENGYIDVMPISEAGIKTPGPAIIENEDGVEEIIGKTLGSLLSHGKKNVYIECGDTLGAGKDLILSCHGDCNGAKIKIVFEALKITI